jgi:hypothetical protein
MPSADAWTQFEADAAKQRIKLTDDKLTALFSYLLTTTPVSSKMLAARTPVPMALAGNKKGQAALCPKGTAATLVFATGEAEVPASSDMGVAPRPMAPAPAMAPAGFSGAAGPVGYGPSTASPAGYGPATGPASYPAAAAAGPTGYPTAAPGMSTAAAYPTAPGFSAAPAGGVYGKLRRALLQALGGAAAAVPDSSVSTDLLLPTAFTPKPDPNAGGATNLAAAMGGCPKLWAAWHRSFIICKQWLGLAWIAMGAQFQTTDHPPVVLQVTSTLLCDLLDVMTC